MWAGQQVNAQIGDQHQQLGEQRKRSAGLLMNPNFAPHFHNRRKECKEVNVKINQNNKGANEPHFRWAGRKQIKHRWTITAIWKLFHTTISAFNLGTLRAISSACCGFFCCPVILFFFYLHLYLKKHLYLMKWFLLIQWIRVWTHLKCLADVLAMTNTKSAQGTFWQLTNKT